MAALCCCVRRVAVRVRGRHRFSSGVAAEPENTDHHRERRRRRRLGVHVSRDDQLSRPRNEHLPAAVPEVAGQARARGRGHRRGNVYRVEHRDRPAASESRGGGDVGNGRLPRLSGRSQPPQHAKSVAAVIRDGHTLLAVIIPQARRLSVTGKRLILSTAAFAAIFGLTTAIGVRAQSPRAALPDWTGVWAMQGNTIFDRASVQPPNGRAGEPGVRESPPYTDEWEARYRRNIELVKQGKFPDPVSTCGTPHGFPRILNVPDVYEFAVTPTAVYVIAENGPNVLRIYTDGRTHPAPEDLWPTYNGASVGHWEGDTLVFTTISLKGSKDNDVIVDRTGLDRKSTRLNSSHSQISYA